ncbi:MAG: universal stress protein [Planctomycetaceae bacterium]|nr:universal stress protein [Planctomycetaceae bacterium]
MTCFQVRMIVVPTDMSEFSLRAIEVAGRIAGGHETIHVVHVMAVIEPIEPEAACVVVDEPMRLEQTRKQLGEFLANHGFGDVKFEVLIGNAGTEITEYAAGVGAGLIVIPSHGRGPIKRLLLGSTTDRVVHLAQCPVLVLKDEKKLAERKERIAEIK